MKSQRPDYELIDHTADIGVRVKGRDFREALEKGVLAFYDLLTPLEGVEEKERIEFEVEDDIREEVVHSVLSELLFRFDTHGFVGKKCRIRKEGDTWKISLSGEKFDPERHSPGFDIKAVTYHMLEVRENGGCEISVIFDI